MLADHRCDRHLTALPDNAVSRTASGTSPFQLACDDVHTWCVSLDVPPETCAGLYAILTCDERNRSARFRFERDRRCFIVAHGVLRELLGHYLGTHPGEIHFVSNAFGKPALSTEFGSRLKFNLSHSADLALIAIAAEADIGVDIEYIRTQPDHAEVARCFFPAADVDQWSRLPRHLHAQAFFSCWTKKEAFVKACGEGLAIPLASFSVPLITDPAHPPAELYGAANDIVPARRWSLYTLQPAPGYIGALAIEGSGWRLTERHWQSSV
jgi:4'-phosphopantetheinyl transferase